MGTDFWRKALNKEMSKVKVAWEARDGITPDDVRNGKVLDLIGFQEIGCHVVFDVKMVYPQGSVHRWWSHDGGTDIDYVFKRRE